MGFSLPLPLPRSIQEMILAKLPLGDLLRSQAVCKYWRRIASTKSFQRRYGATIVSSKPKFLWMHARLGAVAASDKFGKPAALFQEPWNPWIPTSQQAAIVSTSRGLLLILDKSQGSSFTVVNPLTKFTKKLPVFELSSGQEIAYSQIHCSAEDSSYEVFILGVMDSDKLSGVLYECRMEGNPGTSLRGKQISEYKEPFMQVYSSTSGSWSPLNCNFPPGFVLPFLLRSKSEQSIMVDDDLYIITNSDTITHNAGEKIARFNTKTRVWNPVMVSIPEKVTLQCMMVDSKGKLMLVVVDKMAMKFSRASINERNEVVMGAEMNLPRRVYPENSILFGLMEVWGYGDTLVLHVPVNKKGSKQRWDYDEVRDGLPPPVYEANPDEEPEVHTWYFGLQRFYCMRSGPGVEEFPIGAFVSGAADFLKMPFFPSIRAP